MCMLTGLRIVLCLLLLWFVLVATTTIVVVICDFTSWPGGWFVVTVRWSVDHSLVGVGLEMLANTTKENIDGVKRELHIKYSKVFLSHWEYNLVVQLKYPDVRSTIMENVQTVGYVDIYIIRVGKLISIIWLDLTTPSWLWWWSSLPLSL